MGLARTRKVHVLRVTPTKQERRLHTLLARYAGRVERERGGERQQHSRTGAGADSRWPPQTRERVSRRASMRTAKHRDILEPTPRRWRCRFS